MPEDLSELIPAGENGITMTSQRDYRPEDCFPTLLVYEEAFLPQFVRKEGQTPGLLMLLGFVLSEFTKKVLSGQIESAATAPKIAQLLRKTFLRSPTAKRIFGAPLQLSKASATVQTPIKFCLSTVSSDEWTHRYRGHDAAPLNCRVYLRRRRISWLRL